VPSFLCFSLAIGLDGRGDKGATAHRNALGTQGSRLLRLVGDASYSIYLSHLLVMIVSAKLVALLPAGRLPTGIADLVLLALLAVSAGVGILVYRWAEKPMLDLGQRWIRTRFERKPAAQEALPTPQAVTAKGRVRSEWEI
jgi:exopolysaccharide production protein ExoZ